MTMRSSPKGSVFPVSGNDEADFAWAELVAERDLELFCWGTDERLRKTLHAITGKPNPRGAEAVYFAAVLKSH